MGLSDKWDAFVAEVTVGAKELAKTSFKEAVDQARGDADSFIRTARDDLQRWGNALAEGHLSKDDFESLLRGQKSLVKMHALTALGLSQIRLQRFRDALLSLVANSTYKVLGV